MSGQHVRGQGARLSTPPHTAVQELVSKKDQPAIRVDRRKFEPQQDFVPAAAFAAAFKRSDVFRQTRALLDTPFDKDRAHPGALMTSKFGVPGMDSLKALFWREKLLLTANKQGQLYRYIQMAVLAFTVGTVFLRGQVSHDENFEVCAPQCAVEAA